MPIVSVLSPLPETTINPETLNCTYSGSTDPELTWTSDPTIADLTTIVLPWGLDNLTETSLVTIPTTLTTPTTFTCTTRRGYTVSTTVSHRVISSKTADLILATSEPNQNITCVFSYGIGGTAPDTNTWTFNSAALTTGITEDNNADTGKVTLSYTLTTVTTDSLGGYTCSFSYTGQSESYTDTVTVTEVRDVILTGDTIIHVTVTDTELWHSVAGSNTTLTTSLIVTNTLTLPTVTCSWSDDGIKFGTSSGTTYTYPLDITTNSDTPFVTCTVLLTDTSSKEVTIATNYFSVEISGRPEMYVWNRTEAVVLTCTAVGVTSGTMVWKNSTTTLQEKNLQTGDMTDTYTHNVALRVENITCVVKQSDTVTANDTVEIVGVGFVVPSGTLSVNAGPASLNCRLRMPTGVEVNPNLLTWRYNDKIVTNSTDGFTVIEHEPTEKEQSLKIVRHLTVEGFTQDVPLECSYGDKVRRQTTVNYIAIPRVVPKTIVATSASVGTLNSAFDGSLVSMFHSADADTNPHQYLNLTLDSPSPVHSISFVLYRFDEWCQKNLALCAGTLERLGGLQITLITDNGDSVSCGTIPEYDADEPTADSQPILKTAWCPSGPGVGNTSDIVIKQTRQGERIMISELYINTKKDPELPQVEVQNVQDKITADTVYACSFGDAGSIRSPVTTSIATTIDTFGE
eukprot:sb/3462673/